MCILSTPYWVEVQYQEGAKLPIFPNWEPSPIFKYISLNSSLEGKNQSLYPPRVRFAQISAAVPGVLHPASISIVFWFPVPIVNP